MTWTSENPAGKSISSRLRSQGALRSLALRNQHTYRSLKRSQPRLVAPYGFEDPSNKITPATMAMCTYCGDRANLKLVNRDFVCSFCSHGHYYRYRSFDAEDKSAAWWPEPFWLEQVTPRSDIL